ncbi:Periplasmic thiol:disulfide interchange protein DsbA [Gilliamella apicola]|uniref:DsbA family protein n=1 Tax=Gilliamella sp. Choc3-5 TaxID=3120236 RepID=UPI0004DD7C81|nr:DsbA family protein [Gilliamella apicola]KFA58210.1 Periplasmic thiol:disulfide interchange protein DsbA [Gilliamella apicola]
MKKTLIVMGILLSSASSFAEETKKELKSEALQTVAITTSSAPIEAGKQYIKLPTSPSPDKEVIEFFSFNCPSCFRFETQYHATKIIDDSLPEGIKIKRYHLEDFGPLAKDLAQAWAISNILGIEDKASQALYYAIQKDHSIKTADDIKTVFAKLGIDGETYDKTKNSFLVKAFMAQQATAIKELQPKSIPTVIVNRKFYINTQGLDSSSEEAFIKDYARVTSFLIGLDPNKK